jgi:tetratricopeptide (TPR) repeat protein
MKTLNIIPVLIAVLIIIISGTVLANDSKYIEAMQKNIEAVYTAKTIPDYQTAVNALERIGAAEKTKWEPFYYASFGYIMMSNREKDKAKKDVYLDQAVAALDKAKAIVPNESEIIALEGFVYMMRIPADPAARGPQYTPMAMQAFNQAIAVNPENPRALALLAQMQLGVAQFFGSSTDEACATNTKALEKFSSFQSQNPLAPRWGQQMAEEVKSKCGK